MYFSNVYLHMFSSGYALTAFHFWYSLWKNGWFFFPIISVVKWQLWHAVGQRLRWSAHGLNTGARWWPRNVFSKPWTGTQPSTQFAPVGTAVITELDGVWFWIKVMIRSGRMGRFYHFDPYRNCTSFIFPLRTGYQKLRLPSFSNIHSQVFLNFFKNSEIKPSFSQFNYISLGHWRINEAFNRLRWRVRSWIGDFLAQKSPTDGLLKWTWMMNLWDPWTKFCWFVASKLVADFGPCRDSCLSYILYAMLHGFNLMFDKCIRSMSLVLTSRFFNNHLWYIYIRSYMHARVHVHI